MILNEMKKRVTSVNKLTIATWNLRHGGGKRIKRILESLEENNSIDVWILTEFRNNQNKTLIESGLQKQGYDFIVAPDVEPKLNSVLIASKKPFKRTKSLSTFNAHQQRVIKVTIGQYHIYGCYFPIGDSKKEIFEYLLSEIEKNGKENAIITGDINTGKHYLDENGATFYHSEYIEKFEEYGFIDAWRMVHGKKKEYSWFSNTGNGFRLDHFFIDNNLSANILNCLYIHKYREERISDHSMMILEIAQQ